MPIGQFVVFFLLLATGFLCKKYNIFTDEGVSSMNRFVILIAYPCMVLSRTAALELDGRIFSNFMLTLLLNFALLIFFALYARLYFRRGGFSREDAPVAEFAAAAPNNGFMGFPVAITFFGDLGLLYMVACNIALNVFFFTYGIAILQRGRSPQNEPLPKKILRFASMAASPKVSAAFVGIVISYAHIQLPLFAADFLSGVGAVATPMAMISIGTMLAGGFGLRSFSKRIVLEAVLNKLLLVPLICAAICFVLPLDPMVKTVLVVSNTLPVATTVGILAEQYDRNQGLAGEILVISTIFSVVTVPLALWLLG